MKSTHIHIGENILSIMNEKGITKAELARLLEIKPQSVDYLLKRKSIDTDTLYNISVVLDFDFSKLYRINQANSEQINFDIEQPRAKVLVELTLDMEDIAKLKLKNRVLQLLDK
jgi:transcriptional regulator with XRE-family HTH domain